MLRRKPIIENHKAAAEKQLTLRVAALEAEGIAPDRIERDAKVRQLKGRIRQARHQLTAIAAHEETNARKAAEKAEKLARPKTEPPKKRQAQDGAKAKAKKEKRAAAASEPEAE